MAVAFRINTFSGEMPKIVPPLLPQGAAQTAKNLRLTSGRIDAVYSPLTVPGVATQTGTIKSVYRMYDIAGNSFWLNWANTDVDFCKGPVTGDTTFRSYFTADIYEPRATNLALATSAAPYPTAWYVLGVTPPTTGLTCTPSGGTAPVETRAYVYTFVTQWGEESAPSPASTPVSGNINGTWALSAMQVAPLNAFTVTGATWAASVATYTVASTFGTRVGEYVTITGMNPAGYNTANAKITAVTSTTIAVAMVANPGAFVAGGTITRDAPHNTTSMTKNVYRSVTSATDTNYYFVKNVTVATTSVNDDVGSAIGNVLQTVGWAMPPVDMRGIKVLPNGAMVGFSGNLVCFSEPLAAYAWPTKYQLTTDFNIVALGVFGASVVVATQGFPYIGTGVNPANFTLTRVNETWPCFSKRGLVDTDSGVMWPTAQGLVMIGIGGPQLLTAASYTFVEWAALAPSSFMAAVFDGRYYAGYQVDANTYGIFVLDLTNATTWKYTPLITAIWTDIATGRLHIVQSNAIQKWDADTASRMPIEWRSKEFWTSDPVNIGAARVEAEFATSTTESAAYAAALAAQKATNAAAIAALTTGGSLSGASVNKYSLNGSSVVPVGLVGDGGYRFVTFEFYTNGDLIFSKTMNASTTFRLPGGKKYDRFSFRVLGSVPVNTVLLAETARGLSAA